MTTVGVAILEVIPSARGFGGKLNDQISGDLGSSGDKAGRSLGTSLLGGIGKAAAVAGGIGSVLFGGSVLKGGLDRLTTIQDATASLTVIMGDAAKAGALLEEVKKTVQGTPFSLDEFATAGKNLVAMGIAAEKVPSYLTAIGEAAAASGKGSEGVASITDAFGKMAATGKVSLDQVNTIAYAGVPALQILANGFDVTTAEMSKMISKGAVPAAEAMDILSKGITEGSDGAAGATAGYAGTMASLRETLSGAKGGLKSAGDRLGAAILAPFLPMATTGINKLTEFADKATAKVGPAAQSVATELTKMGSAFASSGTSIDGQGSKFERAAVRARQFTDGVQGIFSLLTSGDFKGAKMTFGLDENSGAVKTLIKIHDTAVGAYNILFKGDYTNPIWGGLRDSKAVDVLFKIRENALTAVAAIKGLFTDPGDQSLQKSLDTVGAAGGGALAVLSNVDKVAGPVATAFHKITDAGVGLGTTMIGLAGDSTVVLTAAIKSLGSAMGFLADHAGLVGVALGATAVSMAAAQAVETGYQAARIATAIMMPAQLLVQRALTAAIVEHTRALGGYVGAETSATATTLRGRLAQIARAASLRVSTAATVQATSALGAYAAAQRLAAANSGMLVGGLRNATASVATFAGRVQGVGTAAVTGLRNAASGLMGMLGGPWGLALAAAAVGVGIWMSKNAEAKKRTEELKSSVADVATELQASGGVLTAAGQRAAAASLDQVKLTGTSKSLAKALEELGVSGEAAAAGLAGDGRSQAAVLESLKAKAEAETARRNSTLNSLNPLEGIQYQFNVDGFKDRLNKATDAYGQYQSMIDASKQKLADLKRTAASGGDVNVSYDGTSASIGKMSSAMNDFRTSTGGAADKIGILVGGLSALRGDQQTVEDAQQKVNDSLRGFASAVTDGGAAAVNAAGQIDTSTDAGSRLYDAMKQVQSAFDQAGSAAYQQALAAGQSQDDAAAAAEAAGQRVRDEFIRQYIESGHTREEAEALANTYKLFPATLKTQVELDTTDAVNKLSVLQQMSANILGGPGAQPIRPATPNTSVPAPFGLVPNRRDGGRISGPGTGRSDSILGIDRTSGVPTSWVSNRETVVNEKASDMYEGEIAAMQRGLFPKLPSYADGGRVGDDAATASNWFDRIDKYFTPRIGNEYLYGATGPERFDCSGAVGKAQSLATGGEEDFTGRVGTTHTVLDGSWPGLLAGGSANDMFVIGANAEHMAATINGRPLESGGNDLRWGPGALGAFDSRFTTVKHVDPALLVGGAATSGSASSWTAKDDLNLDSAKVAVQQAAEARAKQNDEKSKATDADKAQADIRIQKAEQRVAELEAKKAAGLAGPAPDAPELMGTYSDEQISARQSELAIERARLQRNEVYADATKSATEREEADLALAQARNQARSKSTGGKGSGDRLMSFTELGGELGKIAAGGLLEFFGAENSTLANPSAFLGVDSGKNVRTSGSADPSPIPTITISRDEAMSQHPFSPDPKKGIEQFFPWMTGVQSAALFDGGGMLEQGMLGFHMRKEPDAVLTNSEMREWKNGNESVRQLLSAVSAATSGGGSERAGDTHYWDVKGPDAEEVATRVAAKFEARMSTSTGRYRG